VSCWLVIYHPPPHSFSLPISNMILLKLIFSPFIIISSKLWVIKSHLSHISWPICCVWYYRWFYSSSTLSSWFGISFTALSWIKFYLLNHSFYVNIENSKSSACQLLYRVPEGSIIGLLLLILYTTHSSQYCHI